MSYVVLARKYRPQSFKEVVGQDPVSQTLVNALESGRIAHAYIFSGPRGIGKTTTARILAKCLNCEKGPSTTPCDQCAACKTIAQGTSVDDVLEIDGASNRGIEQIRELRDSAKYSPASSRYRIYIIDEAHQITKDAFGALLKILEEPPSHVVFMMATTEVQKIPAPILSRCQRFSLRPIPAKGVLEHLKKICKEEKIKVEEEALAEIVRFVEGSLRDALSLLDQALVYAPDGVTQQTLRELLGLLPQEVIQNFAEKIKNNDPTGVLKTTSQYIKDGIDLTQLGKDLQSYYHKILLTKAGVEDTLGPLDGGIKKEASQYEYQTLERNIRLLSRMLDDMRRSDTPRALFEIYSLRLAQRVLDAREIVAKLETLEKASGPSTFISPSAFSKPGFKQGSASPVPKKSVSSLGPDNFPRGEHPTPPNAAAQRKPGDLPSPSAQTTVTEKSLVSDPPLPEEMVSDSSLQAHWPEIIEDVAQERMALAAALDEGRMTQNNRGIVITFEKLFNREMVENSKAILDQIIFKRLGKKIPIETRVDLSSPAPAKLPAHAVHVEHDSPQEDSIPKDQFIDIEPQEAGPQIKKALKHFPGNLKREIKE